MSTTRKTSSYLLSVPAADHERNNIANGMKLTCPVPVDTSGIGDGQAFLRFRASSDEEADRIAKQVALIGRPYSLSTGYGAHFRPVDVG